MSRPRAGEYVTAADALQVPFRTRRLRAGYDQDQVDDFLDRVAESLTAVRAGTTPAMTITAVFDARFAVTRFQPGYDQDDVDDFLDRVADTFKSATPS